jgi:hypothetical protein
MSNNGYGDLVSLETLVELKKAAPQVTQVPWEAARMVVQGLGDLSPKTTAHQDFNGLKYWNATLKDIHAAGRLPEETGMNVVGKACRSMGLMLWREADGYHVAWSQAQLDILKKYFKA